jgi:hypothetical protein
MNYKLSYDFDSQLNCGIICFDQQSVLMNFKDLFSIINFNKNFIYYNPNDNDYPYYLRHNQKISYLEHLFNYDSSNIIYVFKNNNKFDLRKENIIIYHDFHKNITIKYNILDFNLGHFSEAGTDAYVMKNPMWKIIENDKEYWLMYCEKEILIKLCDKSYQKILDFEKTLNNNKNLTWYKCANGYIQTHNPDDRKIYYIHQIITGCYGNGKGTSNVSVDHIDHIDQDPLNNTLENLRIATRDEQEQNSKGIKPGTKRERKHSAKQLPEGITQDMLKKYVVYYKDYADKEKKRSREYFKVEKHPKLNKIWIGTKANNISIQEKLIQANKVVDDLDKQNENFITLSEDINNKNFKYTLCIELDNTQKIVDRITFNISRFRKYKHSIKFNEFVTKKMALQKAEEWLSERVTIEHYNLVKNDLNISLVECEDLNYILSKNKGYLLTDCIYLEKAYMYSTHLFIDCGS